MTVISPGAARRRRPYSGRGNFVVTVVVSEANKLTASTTVLLTIESMDGGWTNTDLGGTIRIFELVQSDASLTGTYVRNIVDTGALSGSLIAQTGLASVRVFQMINKLRSRGLKSTPISRLMSSTHYCRISFIQNPISISPNPSRSPCQ